MTTPQYGKHHISAWFTSLVAIIIALIVAALGWRQVVRYEEGILDIYGVLFFTSIPFSPQNLLILCTFVLGFSL